MAKGLTLTDVRRTVAPDLADEKKSTADRREGLAKKQLSTEGLSTKLAFGPGLTKKSKKKVTW